MTESTAPDGAEDLPEITDHENPDDHIGDALTGDELNALDAGDLTALAAAEDDVDEAPADETDGGGHA